ncbi:MAG: hypothetical protein U0270_30290 [Labilithrix sp.]
MRVAASLALGAFVLVACASDYGSDDPSASDPGADGGASSSGNGKGDGGSSGNGEGGVIPGKPITVSGKIVSYGVGMPNVPVVVGGKTAVNTSALGTFSVPDVTPPYDVSFALKTNDSQPRVTVYKGLTRPDPTLIALGATAELRPTPTQATSLSGTITGASGPGWARAPVVGFAGPNRATGSVVVDMATGAYTMKGTDGPLWFGATSITGTLHAGLVLDNASPVTAFYGKLPNVNVSGGATITDKTIALQSVPVGVINAKVTAPARYTDATKMILLAAIRYEESAGYFLRSTNLPFPVDVKRFVPLVNGGVFQMVAGYQAGGDGESSFARAATEPAATAELSVALADPPQHTEPADGAKGVARSTPFTFTAFANGIHRFVFIANNQPSITIITASTSVTLPDLAPFAITIPSDVEYTWRVAGYRPITSMDADELAQFMSPPDGVLPNIERGEYALSAARKVTLAP